MCSYKSLLKNRVRSILICAALLTLGSCADNSYKTISYNDFIVLVEQNKVTSCVISGTASGEYILRGQLAEDGSTPDVPVKFQVKLANESIVDDVFSRLVQKNITVTLETRHSYSGLSHIVSTVSLGFLIVALAGFVFWLWMLIECATKEPPEGNEKVVWTLIILLANIIGALLYFIIRRPKRKRGVLVE